MNCKVAGFVSTLQMFFTYGLSSRSFLVPTTIGSVNKENGTSNHKSRFVESSKNEHGRYKPPHLRKKETLMQVPKSLSSSDSELSKNGFTSSDSDQSDGDGFAKFEDPFRSSKARIAAINCVQVKSYYFLVYILYLLFLVNHYLIYIYIYVGVCVCVCVCMFWTSLSGMLKFPREGPVQNMLARFLINACDGHFFSHEEHVVKNYSFFFKFK